ALAPGRGSVRGLTSRAVRPALAALLLGARLIGPEDGVAASRSPTPLTAGAATIDVAVPPGTPLGGYGAFPRRAWIPDVLGRHPYAFWFTPSTGVHDPIRVRGLLLESAKVRLLWLVADLVGIDPTLVSALQSRLSRQALN